MTITKYQSWVTYEENNWLSSQFWGFRGMAPESFWLISKLCVLFICPHNHSLTTFIICFLEFGLADSTWSFDQIDTSPPGLDFFLCHRGTRDQDDSPYIRLVTECICHQLYWQTEYHLGHERHEDKFKHWSSLDIANRLLSDIQTLVGNTHHQHFRGRGRWISVSFQLTSST